MKVAEEHMEELLEQEFPGKTDLRVIMEKWDMPFLRTNMLVKVKGHRGRLISGFKDRNIVVRIDDTGQRLMCHPQWEIAYYDDKEEVVKEYTAKTKE